MKKIMTKVWDDFNELNNVISKIEENGIFSKFNYVYKIKNYESLLLNSFMINDDCYDDDDENIFKNIFIDDIEDDSDVLGFLRA